VHARGAAPIAKEGRVGSPFCMEDARRTSSVLGTAEKVTGTVPMVPTRPSTATLSPEDRPEVMAPPSLDDARLESSRGLEMVDTAELLLSADGEKIVRGISSSRAAAQSLEVSSGRIGADLKLGLFLRRGTLLGYGDFLGGLEELKALPFKERKRRMNGVFRVSSVMTFLALFV